jgi:hypothetical protein
MAAKVDMRFEASPKLTKKERLWGHDTRARRVIRLAFWFAAPNSPQPFRAPSLRFFPGARVGYHESPHAARTRNPSFINSDEKNFPAGGTILPLNPLPVMKTLQNQLQDRHP